MGRKIEGKFARFASVAVDAVTPLPFACLALPLLLPVGR